MEMITPLIPLLPLSGLTRSAGQPSTAPAFADLLIKNIVETVASVAPVETLEKNGELNLPDELGEEITADEQETPDIKVDGDILLDPNPEIASGHEIGNVIFPIMPPEPSKQPFTISPGVWVPAVRSPTKTIVPTDVEIPERAATLNEARAPSESLDVGLGNFKHTAELQGGDRQIAALRAPEMQVTSVLETKLVSAVGSDPLPLEIAEVLGEKHHIYTGRLHMSAQPHVAPFPPQERQLARSAISQISEMVQKTQDRGFELRLKPPELGVVRMQFTYSESGLIVHVAAERSDTSELIRRHTDMLIQEFRQMGYSEQPTFSFGRNAQRQAVFDTPKADQPPSFQADEAQRPLAAPLPRLHATGLNIVM